MGNRLARANHSRWFGKNARRILILGLDNSGKTSLTNHLTNKYQKAGDPLPDLGAFKIKIKNLLITLYDLKGDSSSRFFWRHHYQGAQGIFFIIDLEDQSRVDEAKGVLKELLQDEILAHTPIAILCNKADVAPPVLLTELDQLLEISPSERYATFKTTITMGEGVDEAVGWLISKMTPVS